MPGREVQKLAQASDSASPAFWRTKM